MVYVSNNRCKMSGCDREYHGSGFCEYHRTQFRRGIIDLDGKTIRALKSGKALEKCKMEGCDGPDDGKGFCSRHRYWRRMGIIDVDGNKLKQLCYEKEFDRRSQHKKSEEFVMNRYFDGGPLCHCPICGGDFEFYQMDGHHPDRSKKTMTPTKMLALAVWKRPELIAEMDSLKWMCCHCHLSTEAGGEDVYYTKTNTHRIGKAMDKVMDVILNKKGRECVDCHRSLGRRTVVFHHFNPSQKVATVSKIIGRSKMDSVLAEADKCDILCSPCHRKRHHDDKNLRVGGRPKSNVVKRCKILECERKCFARGFCHLHLQQFYRGSIDGEGNKTVGLRRKVA